MITAPSSSVHNATQFFSQGDNEAEIARLEGQLPALEEKKARAESNGDFGKAGEVAGDIAGINNTIDFLKNKKAEMQATPVNDGHMENVTATSKASAHSGFLSRFHLQAAEDLTTPVVVAAQVQITSITNLAKSAWDTMNTSAYKDGHLNAGLLAKQAAITTGAVALGAAAAFACGVSLPTIAAGAIVGGIGILARSAF